MLEHPIPQDITGYKFHIVGSMTVKQFGEIFFGVIIALLCYNSNLIGIVKIPLSLFFVGLGIMLAFVPIQERPLDHWLITFIKVLYKPTKFYWKRLPRIPALFTHQPSQNQTQLEAEVDLSPLRRQRIKDYLTSVAVTSEQDQWEIDQQTRVTSVLANFDQIDTQVQPQQFKKTASRPQLKTRVRNINIPLNRAPVIQQPDTAETIIFDQNQTPAMTSIDQQAQANARQSQISTQQAAQEIAIPELEEIHVDSQISTDRFGVTSDQPDYAGSSFSQTQQEQAVEQRNLQAAVINQSLPFPSVPQEPNKIVGMVVTTNNDILEKAIVEIQNEAGQIVRAVKTNPLGQFFITTPLDDGTYFINVEKDNFVFNTQQIQLVGEIVPPIEIRSN